MDRPREASLFGGSVPPSPTPPLALSDLLAQRPFPAYTPPYGRYVVTPDAVDAPDDQSVQVVASGNETQASPEHQERQEGPTSVDVPDPDTQPAPVVQLPASATDWQAKRNQLRPSKNQGSKADWIRGWSEGVGAHGCETYCACSEPSSVADQSFASKGSEIKSGVRAILRVKRSVSSNTNGSALPITNVSTAGVCPHCSRMNSPPNSAPASLKDQKTEFHTKSSLAKKLNGLLQRAKPSKRKDTHNQGSYFALGSGKGGTTPPMETSGSPFYPYGPGGSIYGKVSKPESRTIRGLAVGSKKVATLDVSLDEKLVNSGKSGQRDSTNGSLNYSDDSDKPQGGAEISKSKARLRRAEELLQKSSQRDTRVSTNE